MELLQYLKRFVYNLSILFCGFIGATSLFAQTADPVQSSSPKPAFIDTAIFADDGLIGTPKISPDGLYILYSEKREGETYLTSSHLDKVGQFRIAVPEKAELNWYRWAGNGKMLFSVSTIVKSRQVERRQTVLYTANLKTKQIQFLGRKKQGYRGDNVLFVDRNGEYLLLSVQNSIYQYPSVYRVEIDTNELSRVLGPRDRVWNWIADNRGTVRMGISYRQSAIIIYYRRKADEKFRRIGKIKDNEEVEDALLEVEHIISEADEGYVLSNKKTGRFALYKFNYLTREIGDMVFGHEKNDVTRFALNDAGTELEAVYYTDSRDRIEWFDSAFAKHQRMLDKALPGQEAWILSKSRDGKRMIIYSTSSTDPGSYYLYQPETKKMIRFAGVNDKLDPEQLSSTKYVEYEARDGLIIPAYLTLPKGRVAKNLPLIIMPHGGPFGVRDTLDYHTMVQFIGNRGYAVLQPNYRGSGSYGEEFYKKGEGQIGRAMQDDLDDGMDWLVAQGTVDASKVCIIGSSYGGYAALWGVTRNPERYRCAASFAGVTDWRKQLRYDGRFFKSRYKKEWNEKIRGEEEFDLNTVSPVRLADTLKRPVLVGHGEDDSNVPFSQFKIYKDAVKKRSHLTEFINYKDEGHGFSDPKNEKDWLDRIEGFLAEHNPAY